MQSSVYLLAEDEPGLAVGRRLLDEQPNLTLWQDVNAFGFGKLRRNCRNYNQVSRRGIPVLLLTDLDKDPCPASKIAAWLNETPHRGFLFRICVRAIEAWLLSDRAGIARFLEVNVSRIPQEPELLRNPKAELLTLARRAPRRIREGLLPVGGASKGPSYNRLLVDFIRDHWSIDSAAQMAPSLSRARMRVRDLAGIVTSPPGCP